MGSMTTGIARAGALKVVDPTLFAALAEAGRRLAGSCGCSDLYEWLGSDHEDRTTAVVLHAFVSRGRRIGVMLRCDGSFDLTISMPFGGGHMPVRTMPMAPVQAASMLNAHVCDEPDSSRRALAGRLGKAISMLSTCSRRTVAA